MRTTALIFSCLILLGFPLTTLAQLAIVKNASPTGLTGDRYVYRFERPEFEIARIDVQVDLKGQGSLKYQRKDEEDPIQVELKLRPESMTRLQKLFETLDFLRSTDTYQSSMEHPNLGTNTITVYQGELNRELTFQFTPNPSLQQISNFFRGLVTQHRRLETLNTARRYQPLDTPKQMKDLEYDLKGGRIAEPEAMLEVLKEFSMDDHLPLITRNHAKRLAEMIEKKK